MPNESGDVDHGPRSGVPAVVAAGSLGGIMKTKEGVAAILLIAA
jgi:hypothetical protein